MPVKSLSKLLRTPQAGALLAVLLTVMVMLPVWVYLGNWYQANLIQQQRAQVSQQISARASALAAAVEQRIALLQGLYAFTRTEWPETDFDQPFEVYSAGIYFNSTGVRTLIIAPEGIARYIFPSYDSPRLSGYDMLNAPDPATRSDVQRAIRNRTITLSQPGELRQGGFGLTAWQAVYRGKDLWGLVSIAVDMNTVLNDSGLTNPASDLNMALRDSLGFTFFGSGEVWQQEPVIQTIALPEGVWELGGAPPNGWGAAVRSQVDMFRLGSLVISGLIAVLVFLTVNRQGQLAQAVALRTRQIAAAQQELERRVEERTREVLAQARRLAVLEERQRLARELHDSVSQVLYSIGLGAKTARATLDRNPAQLADALDYVGWLAEAGQVEMRALIFELRPESLRIEGLVSALGKQVDVLRTRHKLSVQAEFCPEPDVPLEIKESLYRISQEAVHNIVRHARASHVTLRLACSENQVRLQITDDGIGFDPQIACPGHLGLQSMRERTAQCQGSLQITSAPQRGTTIQVTVSCSP